LPRCGSPGALFRARPEKREPLKQREEPVRAGGSQREPRYLPGVNDQTRTSTKFHHPLLITPGVEQIKSWRE